MVFIGNYSTKSLNIALLLDQKQMLTSFKWILSTQRIWLDYSHKFYLHTHVMPSGVWSYIWAILYIYTRMHTHMHTHMYTHTHTHKYIQEHTNAHTNIDTIACTHPHARTDAHKLNICTYSHTHICIYIHAHTELKLLKVMIISKASLKLGSVSSIIKS